MSASKTTSLRSRRFAVRISKQVSVHGLSSICINVRDDRSLSLMVAFIPTLTFVSCWQTTVEWLVLNWNTMASTIPVPESCESTNSTGQSNAALTTIVTALWLVECMPWALYVLSMSHVHIDSVSTWKSRTILISTQMYAVIPTG